MAETSWRDRLFGGLKRTSDKLGENLTGLFTKAALDEQTLDEIEEALIISDLGPAMAARVRDRLSEGRYNRELTEYYLREIIAEEIEKVLAPVARPLEIEAFPRPQVILVIGVNGSGKTTTIAKLANLFLEQDYGVMLAAGDTFRAAAIGQLKVWAERLGIPIVAGKEGGDAAGIVFDAVKQATATGIDVLIVDTAGRLHTHGNLMEELAKVHRVAGKRLEGAPHETLIVIDATTGQNGLRQARAFADAVELTGVVLTKLDGTAKGGIALAITGELGIPVKLIGVGEGLDDLRPFDASEFATALLAE